MSVPDHFGLHPVRVSQETFDLVRKQRDAAEKERDELSADLGKLRAATRVRPSKKALASLKEMLRAMEAMEDEDAAAYRILIEMADKLNAI